MHDKEMKFKALIVGHPGGILGLDEGEVNVIPSAEMMPPKCKCIIRK